MRCPSCEELDQVRIVSGLDSCYSPLFLAPWLVVAAQGASGPWEFETIMAEGQSRSSQKGDVSGELHTPSMCPALCQGAHSSSLVNPSFVCMEFFGFQQGRRNQDIGAIYHGFRAGSAVFTSHLLYNSHRRKQSMSPNRGEAGDQGQGT